MVTAAMIVDINQRTAASLLSGIETMMASCCDGADAACTPEPGRCCLVLAAALDLGPLISSWHLLGGMRHSVCMLVLACMLCGFCCCQAVFKTRRERDPRSGWGLERWLNMGLLAGRPGTLEKTGSYGVKILLNCLPGRALSPPKQPPYHALTPNFAHTTTARSSLSLSFCYCCRQSLCKQTAAKHLASLLLRYLDQTGSVTTLTAAPGPAAATQAATAAAAAMPKRKQHQQQQAASDSDDSGDEGPGPSNRTPAAAGSAAAAGPTSIVYIG